MGTSLREAFNKRMGQIRDFYARRKAADEARKRRRLEAAKTRAEKERVKAEAEREAVRLQRQMYAAKAALQRERELLAKDKRAAGDLPLSERVSNFLHTTKRSIDKLRDGPRSKPRRRK